MNKRSLVYRVCAYNKALNEPNRMKIMKILGSNADNPLTVSQIAEILKISQPTATKHLQVLFDVNFVKRKRVANAIYYSFDLEAVRDYYQAISDAFTTAFTPCNYNYMCDECPHAETCA